MKFIDLSITRENGLVTIKAKSEIIANMVKELAARSQGVPVEEVQPASTTPNNIWPRFQYYRIGAQIIAGIGMSLDRAIGDGSIHAPWLLHKDLGSAEGMKIIYQIPCTAATMRNYAAQLKEYLNMHFQEQMMPFEISMELAYEIGETVVT
jgi:hypothetical protein